MSRAGIQMFAPWPFFSVIGKYVVHCEIFFILGRAASASAVVRTGLLTCRAGSTVGATRPAARASSTARMAACVPSTSSL